jgi:hypothetical protein
MRAYTVKELDELRDVCSRKWLFGCYQIGSGFQVSRTYSGGEKTMAIEEMVRTHMVAGHTAQDLIESEAR